MAPLYADVQAYCSHVKKCIVRGHVCCPIIHDSSFINRFLPIQILIFQMLCNNADARQCSYFKLWLPVVIYVKVSIQMSVNSPVMNNPKPMPSLTFG